MPHLTANNNPPYAICIWGFVYAILFCKFNVFYKVSVLLEVGKVVFLGAPGITEINARKILG